MEWMMNPEIWIALLTLTALEIVLGIDNIVFISILSSKLPESEQDKARKIGLALALFGRVALLLSLSWMIKLTAPWFSVLGHPVSGRDLILIIGGLFLLAKSTHEIHEKTTGEDDTPTVGAAASFRSVIFQILLLDIVFSLDSVITAVGMVESIGVMVAAVVIAIVIMMVFSGRISRFVDHNPTIKMLALSFLLLVGMTLIAEGLHSHIPKGYIYFAMAFSLFVEMLNLRMAKKSSAPVRPSTEQQA